MALATQINTLATRVANYLRDSVLPRLLPAGGTTGQALVKTTGSDYATEWATPSGGSSGHNVDGGNASAVYGGITPIDGGGA